MCKKCDNVDREICALCGGAVMDKTGWATQQVILDAEHQGELSVKLKEVIMAKNVKIKKILNTKFSDQALLELEDLINVQNTLYGLYNRVLNNKVTNVDLEYIDCL